MSLHSSIAAKLGEDPNILSVIRQEAHTDLLDTLGIARTGSIVAPGTPLDGESDRTRNLRRVAVNNLPLFDDACYAVEDAIKAEQRQDYIVAAESLRMLEDGRLVEFGWAQSQALPYEERGLYLLLARMSPQVFLRSFPTLFRARPAARAAIFNDLVEQYGKLLRGTKGQPKLLKLRSRIAVEDAPRSIFAVVSEVYPTAYDGDHFLGDVRQQVNTIDPETRGQVIYDPRLTSVRFDAFWNEHQVVDFSAGDVFRLVLSGHTRDDAGARYRMWAGAFREGGSQYVSLENRGLILKRVHRGKAHKVVSQIEESTTKAINVFTPFLQEWGLLRATPINGVALFGKVYATVPDALTALVESKRVNMGVDDSDALASLLTAWGHQPGNTVADVVCAITKASGEAENATVAEALEDVAGEFTTKWAEAITNEAKTDTLG